MAVTTIATILWLGIAFNLRFLLALGKDRKASWTFYWVRRRAGSSECTSPEQQEHEKPVARAA